MAPEAAKEGRGLLGAPQLPGKKKEVGRKWVESLDTRNAVARLGLGTPTWPRRICIHIGWLSFGLPSKPQSKGDPEKTHSSGGTAGLAQTCFQRVAILRFQQERQWRVPLTLREVVSMESQTGISSR